MLRLHLLLYFCVIACLGKSYSQAATTASQNNAPILLGQMPEACLGFWEDEEGIWRLEIKKEYFGVDNKAWTYDSIVVQNDKHRVKIKDARGAKKEFVFSAIEPGKMRVSDPYLMKKYRASLKKINSDFRILAVKDLPSNYFGHWISVDPKKEPIEVRREGILVNGQLWKYHQILWVAGKYRITLQREDKYHLWIPYWIFEDQLTGVFNPVIPMKRVPPKEVLDTKISELNPPIKAEVIKSKSDGPRKIQIEELPNHFFGNWNNRNGEWLFHIRKEYIGIGQQVWKYGSIEQENDLYILEVFNVYDQGHSVQVKRFTFRFITDYWMEVTDNGDLFEVFIMPFNESFHLAHVDDLPDVLLGTWYHSSGVDSLSLSLDRRELKWVGEVFQIDQVLKKNDGYQFTCQVGEKFRLFRFGLLEDGFLQVNTNRKTQLFNRQPISFPIGYVLGITASLLVLGGLATWIVLRWRTSSIQQKEERKRRQIELELKALRSQMNPHFLFNSLNSIQNLINKQDTDQANHYLSRFSRLMRKVLNHSESPLISLEEEVTLLQLYCELEALRFDFDFDIQVDPELDTYTTEIPSMLIQPFVENAILHGIEPAKNKGDIKVSFILSKELLCCRIEDNGIGIEQSQLLGKNKVKENSFGIRLAEERLAMIQAHYGMDLKIDIQDKSKFPNSGSGTKIEIHLPSNLS